MDAEGIRAHVRGPIVPLSDASLDSDNNVRLTDSSIPVYDFDSVKEEHVKGWGLSKMPASADALHLDKDGSAAMIEFKNCPIKGEMRYKVRRKMYESLLLLEDMVPGGLSFSHESCDFVLVYSEEKNLEKDPDCDPARAIEPSYHRVKIAESLLEKGGEAFLRFGLEDFQNYCYRRVRTYTEKQFEEQFVKSAASIL